MSKKIELKKISRISVDVILKRIIEILGFENKNQKEKNDGDAGTAEQNKRR